MVLWDHKLAESVSILSQAGFDTIEIWGDHLIKTGEKTSTILQALDSSGLKCTVHCPIIDVNICSTSGPMSEASLDLYLHTLEAAIELKAIFFVFHAGNLFSDFDPLDDYWIKLEKALHKAIRLSNGKIQLVVENMEIDKTEEVVTRAADLNRLLEGVAGNKIGICWDTTHLINTVNNLEFLDQVLQVDHVHLSDALYQSGVPTNKHLRLGKGNLDFRKIFNHPKAQGAKVISLETVIINPAPEDLIQERMAVQRLIDYKKGT
jgi:sugar phosphate isomerase/epimerase